MDNATKNSILIVDDNSSTIDVLLDILSNDYSIRVAKNGAKALEIAHQSMPDLILLDIVMPEMSGYEVLEELKASPQTQHIPVVFITGLKDAEDEERGLDLGAADFINKPFNRKMVKARVLNQIKIINCLNQIELLKEQMK